MVLCKNSSTLNNDLQQMYFFINKNNKMKMRIRNVLLKSMDQTIKANSNVNLLQSCNEPKEYDTEQKMSTEEEVCVERQQKRCVEEEVRVEGQQKIRFDNNAKEEFRVERDKKMISYFGNIDNNMTRFFSK